ncbi:MULTISPECIES: two-component system response regulator [Streptomyces]|uniref:response regulator n=1 Tax=Streptomyces TaxID=1883 RepID=UPI00058CDD44|nr:response regulator [Streptomyces sp. SCSIO ZS0520]AOU80557.1 two-component system response regulator [Streptomyces albus]AYN36267.1 response regulator [Streptomyces albus]
MPTQASILIVDDHEDTLYALECALAPLGYPVRSATSGDAALKDVLRGSIGLLVLDVRMPGVSGVDVVRYLRRLEQTQHIPVLLLTGFGADAALTADAYELGVADLVLKPIDPLALRTKVRYLYEAHQRTRALEAELRELRADPETRPTAPPRRRRGQLATGPDTRVPVQRESPARPGRAAGSEALGGV